MEHDELMYKLGSIENALENLCSKMDDSKVNYQNIDVRVRKLEAVDNQALGKKVVVSGVVGAALALIGSFIQAGWFHK